MVTEPRPVVAGAYGMAEVALVVRRATIMQVVIGLQQIQTVHGAMRVYVAEHQGLRRRRILQAAERRIAQLRGEPEPVFLPRLEIGGRAVGPDERAWEQRRGR